VEINDFRKHYIITQSRYKVIVYTIVCHKLLFQWLFQSIQGPDLLFSSVIIFFIESRTPCCGRSVGIVRLRTKATEFSFSRTPWTSDQHVARPLPKHRTTQTKNKRIHTPNIHALSGIRIHDPSV
jgi:hypothetical protein